MCKFLIPSWANVDQADDLAPLEGYGRQLRDMVEAWAIIEDIIFPCDTPDSFHEMDIQSSLIDELTAIISRIDGFDHDDGDLESDALLVKAMAFAARFRITGELGDIDESISLLKTVAQLPNCHHPQVAGYIFTSANLRYGRTQNADDLDRLIESEEALLQYEDVPCQHRFLQLALHLYARSKDKCDAADMERILSLSEEMFPLLSTDSNDLPIWSIIRGRSIARLSKMGRRFPDIRRAFDHVEEVVIGSKHPQETHAHYCFLAEQLSFAAIFCDLPQLREIGRIVSSRPEHTRWEVSFAASFYDTPEAELDEWIALLREGCNNTDPDDECMQVYTMVLAAALLQRFINRDKAEDIQEAIAFRAPFAPFGALLIDPLLFSKASGLHPEFQEMFKTAVITHLGEDSKAWLASNPKPSTLQFHYKFNEFLTQKNILADPPHSPDIDSFAVLDGCRPHAQDHHSYLHDLSSQADRYSSRYLSSHDQADLEQAVFFRQKVVDLLPADQSNPHGDQYKLELARSLFSLHYHSKSLPIHSLRPAFDHLYAVANDRQAAINHRRNATLLWFRHLYTDSLYEEREHHVSEMCDTWLSIVEEQNRLSSNTRATLSLQRYVSNEFFPSIVVIFMIASVRSSKQLSIGRVLQILESGGSLLWGQVRSLRATVGTLPDVNPGLYARLEETSMALKCHLGLAHFPHPKNFGYRGHRAHEERLQVIEEIRSIPGFEEALRDNAQFGIHGGPDCCCTTHDGPIVTLLASPFRCLAIIMTKSGSSVKFLSVTLHLLKQLHDALRDFTKSRNAARREDVDLSIKDDSLIVASTSSHRAGRKSHSPLAQSLEKILECLWYGVAKPVLDAIWEITGSDTKGKVRADQRPPLGKRERIWWCCVGEFSFMPLHAAGVYQGDSCVSVSDYFVSSYTPTVGALLRARGRPLPSGCKILTVAQPEPGVGMMRLPSVRDELQKILEIVPHDNLVPLGGTKKPDPDGKDATVENVVSKLRHANIVHLACHGVQDPRDPLRSGFVLAGGKRLTIEEIMKLDLPNAHTAILSACHTASNDTAIPDESINLASALLNAGFSSILATKWPMSDNDGPLVAEKVYSALFRPHKRAHSPLLSVVWRWFQQNPEAWTHECQFNHEGIQTDTPTECKVVGQKFKKSFYEAMAEGSGRSLYLLSLPEIIDEIARKLRAQGAPAYRWATFIHIGV